MKVLLVNGSPRAHGCTYTALCEVAKALEEEGIETEIFQTGTKPVQDCIACRKCRETGKCVFNDAASELAEKAKTADGFVFGSPVYYAHPAGGVRRQAGRGDRIGAQGRHRGVLRRAEQILHHMPDARRFVHLLEHGLRRHARRSQTGFGGNADDAQPRQEHGVSHQVHRRGQKGGHSAPRSRVAVPHQLHPLKSAAGNRSGRTQIKKRSSLAEPPNRRVSAAAGGSFFMQKFKNFFRNLSPNR